MNEEESQVTPERKAERVYVYTGEINETFSKQIEVDLLDAYYEDNNEPVYWFLNSGGGCIYNALAVYDLMKFLPMPIKIVVMGKCMSAANILLAGADRTYSLENSCFMLHEILTDLNGGISNIKDKFTHAEYQNEKVLNILCEGKNITKDELLKLISKTDYFFSSERAKELGFIDQIVKQIDEVFSHE